jgi:hypothetical protein
VEEQPFNKTDLLRESAELLTKTRFGEYGTFTDNIDRLKLLMLCLTGEDYSDHEVRSFFIALKLCRHDQESYSRDTLLDLIGYCQLINNDQELRGKK